MPRSPFLWWVFFLVCACGGVEAHVEERSAASTLKESPPNNVPANVGVARDPRRTPNRAIPLVTTEVQQLETLFAATATTAPDRPALLRRIAEDYVELRKGGVPSASLRAIARYAQLMTEYPSYAQLDEVLYFLGLEYEVTSDSMHARRTYFDVIQKTPQSKYVPYAYFAFAEMFRAEAIGDASKWPLAERAYQQVIQYPTTPLMRDALVRLAETADAQGDTAKAASWRARIARDFP